MYTCIETSDVTIEAVPLSLIYLKYLRKEYFTKKIL